MNFRGDLMGGESLDVLWLRSVLADGSGIGRLRMIYAALELGDTCFEIVWLNEDSGRATIYSNGKAI